MYIFFVFVAGIYLVGTLLVLCLCVCSSVLVINIHYNCKGRPIPKWTKMLFAHNRRKMFCFIPPNYFKKRTVYATEGSSPCNASFIKDRPDDVQREESKSSASPSSLQKAFTHVWEHNRHNEDIASHNSEGDAQKCLDKLKDESHRLIADNERQWKQLALILDRLFFVILSIMLLLCLLLILFLPWYAPT